MTKKRRKKMSPKGELKFDKVLSKELQKRGLNANSLSLKSGIPRSTLYSWLGGACPDSRTIYFVKVLADFFGVNLDYLLFGTKSKKEEKEEESLVIMKLYPTDGLLYRVKVSMIQKKP